MFLTIVTGFAVVLLPLMAECRLAKREVMLKDSAGCLPSEDFAQLSFGELQFDYMNNILKEANKSGTITKAVITTTAQICCQILLMLWIPFELSKTRDTAEFDTIYLDNAAKYLQVFTTSTPSIVGKRVTNLMTWQCYG